MKPSVFEMPENHQPCDKCGENIFKMVDPPEGYQGNKDKMVNIGKVWKDSDGNFAKAVCLGCRGWGQQNDEERKSLEEDKKKRGYMKIENLR